MGFSQIMKLLLTMKFPHTNANSTSNESSTEKGVSTNEISANNEIFFAFVPLRLALHPVRENLIQNEKERGRVPIQLYWKCLQVEQIYLVIDGIRISRISNLVLRAMLFLLPIFLSSTGGITLLDGFEF